jgi:DNA-binding MarR family transcriptional regulator
MAMSRIARTAGGEALSGLVMDLFRCTSLLLTAGDRLVAPLGLTSARWQVLGAITAAARPQPVAWLARDMGANRQNVQRIVNELGKDGLTAFAPNPHHRRAQLVILTDKGRKTFEAAMRLQAPWINGLAKGISVREIEAAGKFVAALQGNLEEGYESAAMSKGMSVARP